MPSPYVLNVPEGPIDFLSFVEMPFLVSTFSASLNFYIFWIAFIDKCFTPYAPFLFWKNSIFSGKLHTDARESVLGKGLLRLEPPPSNWHPGQKATPSVMAKTGFAILSRVYFGIIAHVFLPNIKKTCPEIITNNRSGHCVELF